MMIVTCGWAWGGPVSARIPTAAEGGTARPTAQSSPKYSWIATGWNMTRIGRIDRTLAKTLFDARTSYALGSRTGKQVQVPSGYAATATLDYYSLATFQSDLSSHRISSGVQAVLYDPEAWAATPEAEQRDSIAAMRTFAKLAHSAGYEVILAPARDLMGVQGAACGRSHETYDPAYLRCDVAGAASNADVFLIQSQADEFSVPTFAGFVERASAQARDANPNVKVYAEVSTSPINSVASSTQLTAALDAGRAYVDGYFAAIFASRGAQLANAVTALRAAS